MLDFVYIGSYKCELHKDGYKPRLFLLAEGRILSGYIQECSRGIKTMYVPRNDTSYEFHEIIGYFHEQFLDKL